MGRFEELGVRKAQTRRNFSDAIIDLYAFRMSILVKYFIPLTLAYVYSIPLTKKECRFFIFVKLLTARRLHPLISL